VQQQFGSRVWTCSPWTVVSLPAGEPHTDWYPNPGARCLIVGPSNESSTPASFVPGNDGPSCLSDPMVSGISLRLQRELRSPDNVTALAVESLVLETMALAVRQSPAADRKEPAWIERVRQLMHDDFRRTIRMSELAELAGVHPVYLARAF